MHLSSLSVDREQEPMPKQEEVKPALPVLEEKQNQVNCIIELILYEV